MTTKRERAQRVAQAQREVGTGMERARRTTRRLRRQGRISADRARAILRAIDDAHREALMEAVGHG